MLTHVRVLDALRGRSEGGASSYGDEQPVAHPQAVFFAAINVPSLFKLLGDLPLGELSSESYDIHRCLPKEIHLQLTGQWPTWATLSLRVGLTLQISGFQALGLLFYFILVYFFEVASVFCGRHLAR